MFYLAVFIWGLICFRIWLLGMNYIEKQDNKKRKR